VDAERRAPAGRPYPRPRRPRKPRSASGQRVAGSGRGADPPL